ncbi:MAG: V-type ATPase subunit subunit G family protein [Candidatus Bathyarchaeota archaeon]
MEMKSILSLGGRLKRLLAKAEEEAQGMVSEAQAKADEIVNNAKKESEQRLTKAQYRTDLDEFLVDAEREAKEKAKQVEKDYAKRADDIRVVPGDKVKEAAGMVVKEVLPK